MKKEGNGLTTRQNAFVREYIKDHNGQKAAERAGYEKKTARVAASRLLTNENIVAELRKREKKVEEKTGLTVEIIQREAFASYQRCIADEDNSAAAQFLKLAGLTIGAFTEKREVQATVETTVELDDTTRAARVEALLKEGLKKTKKTKA